MATKKISKIIAINFLFFFTLLFAPGFIYKIYSLTAPFRNSIKKESSDPRVNYPTYENKKRANQIYLDLLNTKSKYRSFIGWQSDINFSKSTNISGKYNTRKSLGENLNNSYWFFGGSTIWGYGESDAETIPSHFNKLTKKKVFNFGEKGWNSRQSLNQLINIIGEGYIPEKIIFYDGINEILSQCLSQITELPNHYYEKKIREKLKTELDWKQLNQNTLNFIIKPYSKIINYQSQNKINNFYDCDSNNLKSKRIAKHLLNNWYVGYLIAKNNQSEFIGILQPNIYTSKVKYDYFDETEKTNVLSFKNHSEAVYKEIIIEMEQACLFDKLFCKNLINGSSWLKNKENVFIDRFHINGKGNKIISEKIAEIFK